MDKTQPVSPPASKPQSGGDGVPTAWKTAPRSANLIVVSGPGTGAMFEVREGSNSIGRGPTNMIDLAFGERADTAISRHEHAYIVAESGRYRLVHGHSDNPIVHDGTVVSPAVEIAVGARFTIGGTTLQLREV